MNKSNILKSLNKMVIPLTFPQFCAKNSAIPDRVKPAWQALIDSGHISSIDGLDRELKQLTAKGHKEAMNKRLCIDMPVTTNSNADRALFAIANSNKPLLTGEISEQSLVAAKQTYRITQELISQKLIVKSGHHGRHTFSATPAGIIKNTENCSKKYMNTISKNGVIKLLKKHGTSDAHRITALAFSPENRTIYNSRNIGNALRALKNAGIASAQKIGATTKYTLIKQTRDDIRTKNTRIAVVKKASNLAPGSEKRQLLIDLNRRTT